jgi:hypothetical protein
MIDGERFAILLGRKVRPPRTPLRQHGAASRDESLVLRVRRFTRNAVASPKKNKSFAEFGNLAIVIDV